ncbi:MAG: geranylgeranylglyceryl/heptaprenylglyceryl phosphate synthase [Flavobacteriales bacterium]|nr:geranylgeranylglyceryl/heptaprenylglyceryl phosphate synthase [Crocinitomicaceae bacterium]NBX80515.1 geranylgeranylglyceryl/heptaprenylglyceryl phosphate synthase [Flavobacteriales bacterium]
MSDFLHLFQNASKAIAVLIDPEKFLKCNLEDFFRKLNVAQPDFIFVGGSTVTRKDFETCVQLLKSNCKIPLIIFPGASHQISENADALLFLSLISGKNPDFLIGHHIQAAEELENMDIEIISTAYLLIDGGKKTSVEFVSQTTPIPNDQANIARKIALAGKFQGKQLVYLDCGSGAYQTVSTEMAQQVKSIGLPLIIGGGIRSLTKIEELHAAGANVVVIGNKIEEDIEFLLDIANFQKQKHEVR